MNTLKHAVLLAGVLAVAFPAESWAAKTYECKYLKEEDGKWVGDAYDNYTADSKEQAEEQARNDPANKDKVGMKIECTEQE